MHAHHLPNLLPVLVDIVTGVLVIWVFCKIRRFLRRR
jgi:hypothetical protein